MKYILIIILSIFFYEFFNHFNFKKLLKEYLSSLKKLKNNFRKNKFSDLKSEQFYTEISKKLFLISSKILLLFLPLILFFILFDLYNKDLIKFFISIKGIFTSLFTILLYFYLIKKK